MTKMPVIIMEGMFDTMDGVLCKKKFLLKNFYFIIKISNTALESYKRFVLNQGGKCD